MGCDLGVISSFFSMGFGDTTLVCVRGGSTTTIETYCELFWLVDDGSFKIFGEGKDGMDKLIFVD